MGTNENVKNISENIQDLKKVENNENLCTKIEIAKDIQQENNFNSNAQNNNVINQEKHKEPNFQIIDNNKQQEVKQFNMQETQRIEFLSELIKDTEKSKKELEENNKIIQNENLQQNNANEINNEQEQNNKEKPQQITSEQTKPNDLEDIERKQKQHFQDKKDYRLERMLFDRINKMQGKIKESLELIKKFERINAKEENLPNIVTTLHDKLTQEVIKQFRTVGIEFNMKSYLVQSIVSDLLNKFEEGITEFKDCSENLNFVREVQEDFESRVELAPTSKVKNIFARLRGLFRPERKQERLEQLERERQEKKLEEANIHLIKYKFINSELERYTIRKNIVNSLTREILHGQGSGLTLNVVEFISTKVTPEMKKLGLEGLVSELEEKLYEEYKEKENIEKENFLNMQVGEIKRNIKSRKMESFYSKINAINTAKTEENEGIAV